MKATKNKRKRVLYMYRLRQVMNHPKNTHRIYSSVVLKVMPNRSLRSAASPQCASLPSTASAARRPATSSQLGTSERSSFEAL